MLVLAVGVALSLAGCLFPTEPETEAFRFFNDTEADVEFGLSNNIDGPDDDAAWYLIEPGRSQALDVSQTCDGVELVIREPSGNEIDRFGTNAICRPSEIHYRGAGEIEVDR